MNPRLIHAPDSAIAARRDLQALLRHRELQLDACNRSFTVIGHGSVGAKAEQLMQKAWAIEQAGFVMNPRVALAMGFFDAFKERNGITEAIKRGASTSELRDIFREARFSKEEMDVFAKIAKRFEGTPLAVRSSAHGDCRGTGAYMSTFCLADVVRIAKAIKRVLYSEFSEDAVDFRRDAGLPVGMAVIIEPVFGQVFQFEFGEHKTNCVAPQCGGNGFTSTSWGKGLIRLVGGLPTQAVKGGGFNVEEGSGATFGSILTIRRYEEFRKADPRASFYKNYDALMRWIHGKGISRLNGSETDIVPLSSLRDLGVDWLFERLKSLERILGKPQYVEWALMDRGGRPEAVILQIADVELKKDFYEFSNAGKTFVKSISVVGTGQRVCDGLVFAWNPDDVRLLYEYNQKHGNYIIVYSDRLTTTLLRRGPCLRYSDLSNSSVVTELYGGLERSDPPIAHFQGMLEQTGKLFMVVNRPDWDMLERFKREIHVGDSNLVIYDAKFRVTTSERQQKGIIELIDS
ncbi:MAG: PEP/pyruvate-binding domain-containing protein [Candidatus Micrarchaeota archaeon]